MFGKKAIVDCYEDSEYAQFAFFKGKELVVSGNSVEELEKYCDRLAMSGSAATYKFRLYDETAGDRVKPGTDYVCSYDVKFTDPYGGNGVVGGWGGEFLGRIEKLEKKVNGEQQGGDDRITDALMGWLEEPDKLLQGIGALRALFGVGPAPQPGAIGSVEQQSPIITPDQEAKVMRLSKALDKLERHDPNIVLHMEKLAHIAETNSATFHMLLGMLDKM